MSGRYAFAHAVVIPAFSREYVIAFEKEDSKYTLVCIRTKISLYAYQHLEEIKNDTLTFRDLEEQKQTIAELEATLPDDIMDVEAEVVEITLDETLGRKLHKAWGAMLYKTRYPEPESLEPGSHATFGPGFDGVYYHFSFFHGVEPLSGWVWDYKRDGLVGKLVAITEAAKESCDSEDKDTRAFAEKVRDLSVALR